MEKRNKKDKESQNHVEHTIFFIKLLTGSIYDHMIALPQLLKYTIVQKTNHLSTAVEDYYLIKPVGKGGLRKRACLRDVLPHLFIMVLYLGGSCPTDEQVQLHILTAPWKCQCTTAAQLKLHPVLLSGRLLDTALKHICRKLILQKFIWWQ